MLKFLEESADKEVDYCGKYVSIMIQYGHEHSYINGEFLEETNEHFIVKNNKNKVFYINKNKIIYHIFKEN